MNKCHLFSITDESQIGEVRRAASWLAAQLGFDENEVAKIAIIATEATGNLIKHATKNRAIILTTTDNIHDSLQFQIIALDQGPGMANIELCMQDGFSTAGSPGTGLGAMKRLANSFDIYSLPDIGTAICTQIQSFGRISAFEQPLNTYPSVYNFVKSTLIFPKPNETLCGDAWTHASLPSGKDLFLVVDGLGHGLGAHEAAMQAVHTFHLNKQKTLPEIFKKIHEALKSTRGVALALAEIDMEKQLLNFIGIGNINSAIISLNRQQTLISLNGIVGYQVHKYQIFTYDFSYDSILIMHSDGIKNNWQISDYPGLQYKSPHLIASVLYRDYCRGNDDSIILTAKAQKLHK